MPALGRYTYKCSKCGLTLESPIRREAPFEEEHPTGGNIGSKRCNGKFFRLYKVPLDIKIGGVK